ncbi:NAD kinase [Fibrobacterales bacterium]|nr:NAD kinase [Fibrobacterales bacterium]
MKIGIITRRENNPNLEEALESIRNWEKSHSTKIVYEDEKNLKKCDAIVAVGGDGTVLSAAHIAFEKQTPIVGINAGRVGFLADYKLEEISIVLNSLASGDFGTQNRIMLDGSVFSKGTIGKGKKNKKILNRTVLNEIFLHAHAPQRMINLEVKINDKFLTEYWADSLMLATPTGSTAYNLAAGGPIIYPSAEAFVLNPVNPMSLSVRPLIIPSNCECKIRCVAGSTAEMVFDGHFSEQLNEGEELRICKSKFLTRFARINTPADKAKCTDTKDSDKDGFVQALKEKLGWTGKITGTSRT